MARPAVAQVVRSFTARFSTNVAGDIRLLGNTLLYCPKPGANGCTGNNNSFSMVHFKDTPDATVLNRSTADLALPAGATVVWAGLYWGGRSGSVNVPANRNQMKFRTPLTPAGTYVTVTSEIPLDTFTSGSLTAYQGFATVTGLVSSAGSGTYVGADVKSSTGSNGYAGWALVVVFTSPTLPTRNLVVFDGFANVTQGEAEGTADTVETTLTGFLTPVTGAFTTRVGVVGYEGDATSTGDQVRLNNVNVSDAANPFTNFFNSSNAFLGANVTARNPSFANMLGFDIDMVDVSGILPNGARSTTVTFTTANEQYYPGVLTLANDIFQPVIDVTKTVTDLNGGTVEPGDVLEYVITAANTGNDPATAIVLEDPIPLNTTYEPDSLATLTGVDVGPKTDEPGDDQAEFIGTAVRFRLGIGATATTGGTGPPGGRGSFRFRVRVNDTVPGNTVISNQARFDYVGATSGQVFVTLSDGDPRTVGVQPTTITTAQARASVSLTKVASPNPVVAGQDLTYTLTVTNAGPSPAADTVVTDAIPTHTTFVSASAPAGWTIAAPAVGGIGTVTFTHPDLAVGSTTLTLVVQVNGTTTATAISNTATVASPTDPTSPDTAAVNTSVVPAQDLTIQKEGPARAAQNQTLTYLITVTNPGPNPASSVTVTDSLPPATTFVAASAPPGWVVTTPSVGSPGTVTYTHASLAPGTYNVSLTVRVDALVPVGTTITNQAVVTNPDDSNPSNNAASTFGTVVVEGTDLAVAKTVSPAAPMVGDTVTYTLVVNNFGPSNATGVRLTDSLPTGLAFVAAQATQGTYDSTTGVWTIGDLTTGARVTLTLDARVLQTGALTNTATNLAGNQIDPDPANNQSSATLTVRAADITLAKSVDNATPVAGDTVTFTLTATNQGPGAATQVRVADPVPVGLSFVAADPAPGTTYDPATGAWQIAALGVGASATLRLTARVETSGTIPNEATVVSGEPTDPSAGNNVATTTLTATPSADLAITKTVSKPVVDFFREAIAFTVTVENRGPSPATGVVVDDLLPAAFTPPSVTPLSPAPMFTPSKGTYDATTNRWSIGDLEVNERATLQIVVQVYDIGTHTNTAQVRGNEADPVGTNNTASASVRVLENELVLTKTVDNPTPPLGGIVTYTIRVTNHGPDPAGLVPVFDPLDFPMPGGKTAFVSASATHGTIDPAFFPPEANAPFLLWTIETLPVGETASLKLVKRVTSLGPIENMAVADLGLHVDVSFDNNIDSVTIEGQPTADLVVTKSVSATTPAIGDTVTFTVTVTNRGPGDATGVQVSDGLPAGLTLVSSTPSQGLYDSGTSTWEVGALTPGAAATLALAARVEQAGEVTNVATRTVADQFDPDPSNNTGGVTLTGQPSADIQVLQTVNNPAPNVDTTAPNVNDTVTLTLTVRNAGPSDATGVQVTDLLPAGLTLVSAAPSQGTYSADTGVWDIAALAQGDSVTLEIVATVTQAGTFTILASKTAQGEDDPVGSNNASGVILNGQAADVQVLKTVDVSAPLVGHTVTFTVTVLNNGPSAATGVAVTEQVPAGLTVLAATPSQGTYAAATGVWTVGTLASRGAGTTATLQVEAQVTQAGDWTNPATRTALDQADPNPLNDQGTATIHATLPVPPPPPPAEDTPPVATDDEVPTPVDGPVTIAVLGNDRDPDGDPLTVVAVTQPLGGTVLLNADGTLTYTPRPGFHGPDTFTYTISDGRGRTATSTVRVTAGVSPPGGPGPVLPVLPPPAGPEPVPPILPPPVGPEPEPTVLAPPAGRKTVTVAGPSDLVWRLMWINPENSVALTTRMLDPLPAATTYVDDSVTCTARGQSTVQRCAFEATHNQVVYEGAIGSDPGVTTEDQAANAVVITFRSTVLPGVTRITNQALTHWDAHGTGTVDDDLGAGQVPVLSGTAFGNHDPTSVTLPGLACVFQQRLVALASAPRAPDADTSGDDDAGSGDSAVDAGVDRQQRFAASPRASAPEADGVFALRTPRDGALVAGTAVTLAALPLSVLGMVVSRTTGVTLANGPPVGTVDLVENPGRKEEAVAAHEAAVVVAAHGVSVELGAASLAADDRLRLVVVDAAAAPGPLPGLAAAPLVALTLVSGRTAFSGPVQLSLPYPDAEPDGLVDGMSPALPATALTVWGFDRPRGIWVRFPEARMFPAFPGLVVQVTQTGLYGVFHAADGSLGVAGTTGPSPPTPRSAPAQGSGWQDIGVVTAAPFLVPWNTPTLPDGDYELRLLCATQSADLVAVQGNGGEPATTAVAVRSASDGGSGCFIATAAYGSSLAPQVQVLRVFREAYLRPWRGGRWLIRLYETMSPPLAALIREHAVLRLVVRGALTPVVWIVGVVAVGTGSQQLVVLVGVLLGGSGLGWWITRCSDRKR